MPQVKDSEVNKLLSLNACGLAPQLGRYWNALETWGFAEVNSY